MDRIIVELDPTGLAIWPNPTTSGSINLRLDALDPKAQTADVRVLDVNGREVYSARWATEGAEEFVTSIDLAGRTAGLYVVQVRSNMKVFTERLILE